MTTFDEWRAYERFRAQIADVMDGRFYTLAWLDGEIWSGRARIFTTAKSAIVATLKVFPTGARAVHGLVAVGELDEIVMLIRQAELWGTSLGCVVAEIESREGWAKALKGFGYERYQVTVRKEL